MNMDTDIDMKIIESLHNILTSDVSMSSFESRCDIKHLNKIITLIDDNEFNVNELEKLSKIAHNKLLVYFNLYENVNNSDNITMNIHFDILNKMLNNISERHYIKCRDFIPIIRFNNQFVGNSDTEHNNNMIYLCDNLLRIYNRINDRMLNSEILEIMVMKNCIRR